MRIDVYTKAILTLIALFLGVMVLKPIFHPTPALAQGGFGSIQFSYSSGEPAFFDSSTGDVWLHDNHGHMRQHFKMDAPGHDLGH